MTFGPLEALRAARRLAISSTACPPWCNHAHDLTGDDRGISHECVVIGPSLSGPVEAYLRAREMAAEPGILGPGSLAIFTTERGDGAAGWYVEIRVDGQLGSVEAAIAEAVRLMNDTAAQLPWLASVLDNSVLKNSVLDLKAPAGAAPLLCAT